MKALQDKSIDGAKTELNDMTPPPMNSVLEKQSREDAIRKKDERRSMVVEAVQPSNPGRNMSKTHPLYCQCGHLDSN